MKSINIILLFCIGFLLSCVETELPALPPDSVIESIFSTLENRITDGQEIHFDLPSNGTYTLTLIDKENEQVITREKFNGVGGKNVKRIYTNSIQSKILYILLEDEFKTNLGKTTIII